MQDKLTNRQNDTALPLVSFVIPCYNLPIGMIRECIDSILALPLDDNEREVILVDDGSTESPLNGLLNYADKLIYIRQANGGVASARNVGIDIAKGKYIQFVDGDDYLMPAAYEMCLEFVRNNDTDMVLFQFSTKQGRIQSEGIQDGFDGPMSGREYMLHNNIHASPWGYIFRRALLGTLRFHNGIRYGEDEEFTPQLMLRAESIYTTKARAYYYRQRTGSAINDASKRGRLGRLDNAVEVICNLRERADILPYGDRAALQRRIDQLTMDYLYNVIVLTRSRHYLDKSIKRLYGKGLFPLPVQDYTTKYKYFSRMINSRIGQRILLATLPAMADMGKSK